MRWIKASEPKGEEKQKLSIKYKGSPDLLIFLNGRWCWVGNSHAESNLFPVHKESWTAIEWLDEGQSDSDAVAFKDWCKENTQLGNFYNGKLMTSEQLYDIFKNSKP